MRGILWGGLWSPCTLMMVLLMWHGINSVYCEVRYQPECEVTGMIGRGHKVTAVPNHSFFQEWVWIWLLRSSNKGGTTELMATINGATFADSPELRALRTSVMLSPQIMSGNLSLFTSKVTGILPLVILCPLIVTKLSLFYTMNWTYMRKLYTIWVLMPLTCPYH